MEELEALKQRLEVAAAEATKTGNTEEVRKLKEEFQRKMREVSEQVDPHQTALRERISMAEKFEYVGKFVNGAAFADKEGAVWLVDTRGNFIEKDPFSHVTPFSPEGIAMVKRDDRVYYIDTTGKELFPGLVPEGEFHEGRAWAQKGDNYILIDAAGREIVGFPTESTELKEEFHEGMCVVGYRNEPRRRTIIDREGKVVGDYEYGCERQYSEGAIVVRDGITGGWDREFDLEYYVDKKGERLFSADRVFAEARNFSEGVAAVVEADATASGWSFIDKTGEVLSKKKKYPWAAAGDFHEGLAWVKYTRNIYSFVDRSGAEAFSGDYAVARDFSEGLAAVRTEGSWKFINTKGERAFPGEYSDVTDFSGGVAAVGSLYGGRYQLIDKTGKVISSEGMSNVQTMDQEGLILGFNSVSGPNLESITETVYFSRRGKRMFTQNK